MKIHEYQACQTLQDAGIPVPPWRLVEKTDGADGAAAAFDEFQPTAVVKAQIHAGGRGKGGGVKVVRSRNEARMEADRMFQRPLVTVQTGPAGKDVKKVIVAKAVEIAHELYVSIVIDRSQGLPVLMTSTAGGMDIEEVAEKTPEKILRTPVDPNRGLAAFAARNIAFNLGLEGKVALQMAEILVKLCRLFLKEDCSLVEVNPLVVTKNDKVMALDAKINFDDNAKFRHPEWEAMRDPSEENPAEREAQKSNLSYIKLEGGNIGCLVNGAGLAMSTMDIIKLHGGAPANFLDAGGGASEEQTTQAFRILLADPDVKAVLVNIFGGITKCDEVAHAIIAAARGVGFTVPLVVRLEGTNADLGRKILEESGLPIITATGMKEAAERVVTAAGRAVTPDQP